MLCHPDVHYSWAHQSKAGGHSIITRTHRLATMCQTTALHRCYGGKDMAANYQHHHMLTILTIVSVLEMGATNDYRGCIILYMCSTLGAPPGTTEFLAPPALVSWQGPPACRVILGSWGGGPHSLLPPSKLGARLGRYIPRVPPDRPPQTG